MVGQALTNVLKNAAEAVAARRRARRRSCKGRHRRARLRRSTTAACAFEVEDNGVGLPAKDRDRLTEPYVTTREKGTGLGLAIVKRILEDHGGELELADARERRRARVAILRLPGRAGASASQARPRPQRRHEEASCMAADILVVDDEADIRELVAGILDDEGYAVRTAADCDERAGRRPARASPSLLVLDIWMQGGGMDGLELLDLVKELDPDLPVVMISGHGNIETAVSAIKRGAYDFLEKPFKSDRLLLVVERALEATQPASARTGACAPRRSTPDGLIGQSDGRPAAAPADRQGRAGQQPRADLRPARLRQGDWSRA